MAHTPDIPYGTLAGCPLFEGVAEKDTPAMLACLRAKTRRYAKNDTVFHAGQPADTIGVVLAGGVHIQQEDYWGNRDILAHIGPGGLFGEAFAYAGAAGLPVSVQAAAPAEILLINAGQVVAGGAGGQGCPARSRLAQNMVRILAQKNVVLTQKLETITRRTTREKLLAYLSRAQQEAGAAAFAIPFSRQQLADYLAVDRSAMSAELSRMQRDGLVRYRKNWFELLDKPEGAKNNVP